MHGHSYRHSDLQYYSALTQLLVLGVLDPTGIMAFALSGIPSLMLTAYEKKHSREDEACADATGLAICARGWKKRNQSGRQEVDHPRRPL